MGRDTIRRFENKSNGHVFEKFGTLKCFLLISVAGLNYSHLNYNVRKALRDLKSYPDIVTKRQIKFRR